MSKCQSVVISENQEKMFIVQGINVITYMAVLLTCKDIKIKDVMMQKP